MFLEFQFHHIYRQCDFIKNSGRAGFKCDEAGLNFTEASVRLWIDEGKEGQDEAAIKSARPTSIFPSLIPERRGRRRAAAMNTVSFVEVPH